MGAALALASGCFYTDGVNSEPQARLEKQTQGPHHKGTMVVLSGSKSEDPDGATGALVATWAAIECEDDEGTICPPSATFATSSGSVSRNFAFEVPGKKPVFVILTVNDSRGAQDQETMLVSVQNRDPTLSLQVQGYDAAGGGYPIGTTVDIYATAADADMEGITYEWSLFPAKGSVPANVGFTKIDDTHYRLDADVVGLWNVQVVVSDADGGSVTETAPVLVQEDAPPCIASTDPLAVAGASYILDAIDDPRRFAVLNVTDDLDVYPPPAPTDPFQGPAEFRWFVASPDTNGTFVELPGHEVADYFVDPALYSPGDELQIRVEIDDRVGRTIPCDPSLATCSLGGDTCLQRVTWGVEIR